MGVTCGALRRAVADGFNTVDALRECTGASQACGACRPLLVTLVERRKSRAPARERSAAIVGSLVSILLVLMLVAVPAPEIGKSVRDRAAFDALLLDPILRQVTGYAALALALGGLSMSARKRWRAFTKGTFEFWRVVHVWIGAATLGMLALHTGFRLGKQFNLGFVIAFLAVALAGAAAGLAAAGRTPRPLRRRRYNFLHVALFWLLPALTAVHILTVYYF
jgi:nitrite reductase (NADH) large subunit